MVFVKLTQFTCLIFPSTWFAPPFLGKIGGERIKPCKSNILVKLNNLAIDQSWQRVIDKKRSKA